MSYTPNLQTPITFDASNRLRVGQLTTLFDGKILNFDDPLIWETVGTGLSAFETNKVSLSVISPDEFYIRKSKRYFHYFSGKSQQVEITFDRMHSQTDVTKRTGYFSSLYPTLSTGYTEKLDGFWLEDDGVTKRLKAMRSGTETLNVPMSAWDNYKAVENYDWSKFTVILFDFLWLGGAILRFFVRTPEGLTLIHTFDYPGIEEDTFTESPNHPIRYEIRSEGGSGEFRPICSQVSTEGSVNESGKQRSINTGSGAYITPSIGTTYALLGIRKKSGSHCKEIKIDGLQTYVSSNNDILLISLKLNPTLSSPLNWTSVDNSSAERGLPDVSGSDITTTVTGGIDLFSFYITQGITISPNVLDEDFLSSLGVDINFNSDEMVLCGTPATASINTYSIINYKDY